jgi:hypothetical protein
MRHDADLAPRRRDGHSTAPCAGEALGLRCRGSGGKLFAVTRMLAWRGIRVRGVGVAPARVGRLAVLVACAGFVTLAACGDSGAEPEQAVDNCPDDLPTDVDCPAAAPKYSLVVSRIVTERCGGCHYQSNPFSSQVFVDYDSTYAARRTMLTQVYGCNMPPVEAQQLSAEERGALLKWFTCGAPQN